MLFCSTLSLPTPLALHLVSQLFTPICPQVGSIVPDNAPIIMGMPDTFFDDDTLIQRIVSAAAVAPCVARMTLAQVDKLTDGAEIVAGCFRIRPEQRGAPACHALRNRNQTKLYLRSVLLSSILTCTFSGKLGQCRIGADGELLELVDKNKDCPFE
jgi:hypothetical protein